MQVNLTPFKTADDAVTWGRDQIDAAAGRACARYITIAPGQEARYTAKYKDACNYVAAGYPADTTGYPWIAAEAQHTGLTPQAAADRIKQLGDSWNNQVGPAIEGQRVAGKDGLAGRTDIGAIVSYVRGIVKALDAI